MGGMAGETTASTFSRGYAILVITVNHIIVSSSPFHLLTGNVTFYTSFAEEFCTMSGLAVAQIADAVVGVGAYSG
jgi:hypothetical protein